MTFSEFGRTLSENGRRGTMHRAARPNVPGGRAASAGADRRAIQPGRPGPGRPAGEHRLPKALRHRPGSMARLRQPSGAGGEVRAAGPVIAPPAGGKAAAQEGPPWAPRSIFGPVMGPMLLPAIASSAVETAQALISSIPAGPAHGGAPYFDVVHHARQGRRNPTCPPAAMEHGVARRV